MAQEKRVLERIIKKLGTTRGTYESTVAKFSNRNVLV